MELNGEPRRIAGGVAKEDDVGAGNKRGEFAKRARSPEHPTTKMEAMR